MSNFKVYVNMNDHFLSKLPPTEESIDLSVMESFNKSESFYASICGAYIATYLSGVSMKHLEYSSDVHPIITSIMNFHVYFWISRFIAYPDLINSYYMTKMEEVKKHTPWRGKWRGRYKKTDETPEEFRANHKGKRVRNVQYQLRPDGSISGLYYLELVSGVAISKSDYTRYIPDTSDGFTETGRKLLSSSIEAYVYAVLGAQAVAKFPIVSTSDGSLTVQSGFRDLVRDGVVNYKDSVWINNMNTSISETNVTQDLALSPNAWLIPSNMIILKKPIPGYNNMLKSATEDMKFGVNKNVNYVGVSKKSVPKKLHQDAPTDHLNTLGDNDVPSTAGVKADDINPPTTDIKRLKSPTTNTETPIIVSIVLAIASFVVLKYVV